MPEYHRIRSRDNHNENASNEPAVFDDLSITDTIRQEAEEEGGEIPAGPPSVTAEPRSKIRERIASRLLWLLAVLILVHHVILAILIYLGKTDVKTLEAAFNSVLPVLAGLFGTAVAFYFKEK